MYQALLISIDGQDTVTDYGESKTKEQVWAKHEDAGSRWFFYPIALIIKDKGSGYIENQRIVDVPTYGDPEYFCPWMFEEVKGKSIKRALELIRFFQSEWLEDLQDV